jgi:hypothetical protein
MHSSLLVNHATPRAVRTCIHRRTYATLTPSFSRSNIDPPVGFKCFHIGLIKLDVLLPHPRHSRCAAILLAVACPGCPNLSCAACTVISFAAAASPVAAAAGILPQVRLIWAANMIRFPFLKGCQILTADFLTIAQSLRSCLLKTPIYLQCPSCGKR